MSAPIQAPSAPPSTNRQRHFASWQGRILGFSIAILTLQIGIVLTTLPWLTNWDQSWVPVHAPRFADLWMSPYFRAALSGLGLLNIYIAGAELFSQLKSIFAAHP
jgi:hypothetical protein